MKYLAHKTFTLKAGEKLGEPVVMNEKGMVSPKSVSLAGSKSRLARRRICKSWRSII